MLKVCFWLCCATFGNKLKGARALAIVVADVDEIEEHSSHMKNGTCMILNLPALENLTYLCKPRISCASFYDYLCSVNRLAGHSIVQGDT